MNDVIEAFNRGVEALRSAEKLLNIDLPTSANRIYIAGENLAISLLLAFPSHLPKDHGKIWNAVQRFYERGILKSNYRPLLQTSYMIRIKADYGRDLDGVVAVNKKIIEKQIMELKNFRDEISRILTEKGLL